MEKSDSLNLAEAIEHCTFEHTIFTYDNEELQDGLGAQLQRVLGVRAMARVLGAPYLHTPIKRLGFLGLSNVEGNSDAMLTRVAQLLPMASDAGAEELARAARVERLNSLRVASAAQLRGEAGKPVLLRISMPYPHLEEDPDGWLRLGANFGLPASRTPYLRIALHVRRGELHFIDSDRLLPNSYYIAVARRVGAILTRLGVSHRFELFTEATDQTTSVPFERVRSFAKGAPDLVLTPEHDNVHDFDVLEPLERFINADPIDTLAQLATADVLIASKSSFSFVAGLLAPQKLVLYAPFWHRGLSDWVATEPDGAFDEEAARQKIERTLAARHRAALQAVVDRARSGGFAKPGSLDIV